MTTAVSKLLNDLREGDVSLLPINLKAIKANLGELVERPRPYGKWGEPSTRVVKKKSGNRAYRRNRK